MWDSLLTSLLEILQEVWRREQAEPSLWLAATLIAYAIGMWGYKKSGYKPICTPLGTLSSFTTAS